MAVCIWRAKRNKFYIPFRSVLNGHLQDVQHPSRIEGFREFEVDLSALFCKKYYFNKRNERFPYYKQYE